MSGFALQYRGSNIERLLLDGFPIREAQACQAVKHLTDFGNHEHEDASFFWKVQMLIDQCNIDQNRCMRLTALSMLKIIAKIGSPDPP